jgi:hypothetical protein
VEKENEKRYNSMRSSDMAVQYVIDETGKKTGVVLSIEEYEEILERLEDTEALEMLHKLEDTPRDTRNFEDYVSERSLDV